MNPFAKVLDSFSKEGKSGQLARIEEVS